MPLSEPPSSLALDDIMLIEDDEEGNINNNTDVTKITDIQDQLQKQAEIIRDLLVQRDYLINQILQERERWQVEREGWDRTSEALVARHARKERESDSGKEEELAHRCAVYESDNKGLKEKLHDTQTRLTDLEVELSKLRPLLVMQSHLIPLQRRSMPLPYPYLPMPRYMSPFPAAPTRYAPYSSRNAAATPTSANSGRKRKRGDHVDPSSSKRKKREGVINENASDSNGDGDTDTEAPPTPTPTPASWNPYAYMNDFYTKPSPLKHSNDHSTTPLVTSSPSSALSFNTYTVSYPYQYIRSPSSKQPSVSNSGASPIPFRSDDAHKDGSKGESHLKVEESSLKQDKAQPSLTKMAGHGITETTLRRTQQGKNRTTTLLSDARAEHLLIAARKIGRERAATVAGFVQDRLVGVPEETTNPSKDKAKVKEPASGSSIVKRSAPLKSQATLIRSPSTPTPRRIQGSGDKMHPSSPLARPSSSSFRNSNSIRSRDTLISSTRSVTRTLSTISSGVNASSSNLREDDKDVRSSPVQTPLDSLVSAARTMMSEDGGTPTRPTVSDSAIGPKGTSEDTSTQSSQSHVEKRSVEESLQKRKRRRNTTTTTRSPATPRPRAITEKQATTITNPDWKINSTLPTKRVPAATKAQNSALSSQRAKSALDVLADQAAAVSDGGGSVTNSGGTQSERGDQVVHNTHDTPSSASYSGPHLMNEAGTPIEPSLEFLRDFHVPSMEETTQTGVASSSPRNCSASDDVDESTKYDIEVNVDKPLLRVPQDGSNNRRASSQHPLPGAAAPPGAPQTPNTSSTTPSTTITTSSSGKMSSGTALHLTQSFSEFPHRHRVSQVDSNNKGKNPEFYCSDPFGSQPNLATAIIEPAPDCMSASSEGGDLDAEGDIDPDSQDASLALDI